MTVEINYNGEELIVEGNYYGGEDVIAYDNSGGHPGSPADFELETVYWGDVNVTELILVMIDPYELEELVLEKLS